MSIPLGLIFLSLLYGLPQVMSTLAPYDDEGYVMMTVQSFSAGERLYGSTHTQYGPAFYLITEPIHRLLQLPLTQDAVRWKTLSYWVLSVLLIYASLIRLQVAWGWAAAASLLSLLHLDKLALEPGHPQELALILSLMTLWILSGTSRWKWGMASLLVGCIGMIKINCGVVIGIPLLLASCVRSAKPERGVRYQVMHYVVGFQALLILFLPISAVFIASTSKRLADGFPVLGCLGSGLALLLSMRGSFRGTHALGTVYGVGIATASLILMIGLGTGISTDELWQGIVGQHRTFASTFFHPIPWIWESLLFVIVAWMAWLPRFRSYRDTIGRALTAIAILGILLSVTRDTFFPLKHGLQERGAATWLALVGPALSPWIVFQGKEPRRFFLGWMASMGPIIAFPTPGTQLALGTLPSLLAITVLFQDFWGGVSLPATHAPMQRSMNPILRRFSLATLCMVALATGTAWSRWRSQVPLGLPGSEWVRVPQADREREREIVRAIEETGCQTLVFDGHNHNRFYFWTGLRPLTAANPTFWPNMLQSKEQERWSHALRQAESICVVLPPDRRSLATSRTSKLQHEILQGLIPFREIQGWHICLRMGADGSSPNHSTKPIRDHHY